MTWWQVVLVVWVLGPISIVVAAVEGVRWQARRERRRR